MSAPVLFVLGAGPKIGLSVGQAFAAKGYKVALAARSLQEGVGEDGFLRLNIDFANQDPAGIQNAFAKVTEKLGVPSVVVYNAADRVTLDPEDPLTSATVEDTTRLLSVNVISPLIAAQEAVKGFKTLPASASRTFIATGNLLNTTAWPPVLTFGMTKTALAHLIHGSSKAYEKQGFKFYYADERQADGGATIPVSGPAAGEAYTELAEKKEQGPWNWTFVEGKGYVEFK
ncbi:putative short-chain dehydrogenase [Melanomma pulvis-pyrius CBS 109.77]|uniref:Putative short-chain dehydrogenase n=1 Tax=Melanomma pulvis-pyrius CBS 109.77 TaxID=1314802 RepID=A0A6A6XPE3_9PLEO|nr:putative short-chain dehydrogenase [Melanomma pulvis-pyrius CBS 109.77]